MTRLLAHLLSRRERQIMDALFRLGHASAAEVMDALPDPPSYSAVRALLRVLERKGHVAHDRDGPRYIYRPAHARGGVARTSLRQVVETFFGGSIEQAVATLVSDSDLAVTDEELARLAELIEQARKEGRQ